MSAVQSWQDEALGIANQFRLGMNVPAAVAMVDFLQRLVAACGPLSAARSASLNELVGAMLACQERQDWLGLADYLVYELPLWLAQGEGGSGA